MLVASSKDEGGGILGGMTNPTQLLLIANLFFVVFVLFLVRRMLKAASIFKWNPGDNDVQGKQKLTILRTIVLTAFVTLIAAIMNAFFG